MHKGTLGATWWQRISFLVVVPMEQYSRGGWTGVVFVISEAVSNVSEQYVFQPRIKENGIVCLFIYLF